MNDLGKTYNSLTDAFLTDFCANNPKSNIVFSPLSIIMLLAIAAESVTGQANE